MVLHHVEEIDGLTYDDLLSSAGGCRRDGDVTFAWDGLVRSDVLMARSVVTIDLAAVRHNARSLLAELGGAELWAVVKADGYGHGAADVAPAALDAGATALCVATVPEALALRPAVPGARMLVLGPTTTPRSRRRPRRLAWSSSSPREARARGRPRPRRSSTRAWAAGGSASCRRTGPRRRRADDALRRRRRGPRVHRAQLERFLEATGALRASDAARREQRRRAGACRRRGSTRRAAGSRSTASPRSATGRRGWGLRPALRWGSELAGVEAARAGREHRVRAAVRRDASRPGSRSSRSGYADGFRRDLTGTEVLVAGERRRVVGTVSMDVLAVELPGPVERGRP